MRRSGFSSWREIGLAVLIAAASDRSAPPPAGLYAAPRAAFAIVNLATGATIASAETGRLDEAIAPGSTMKIVALVALLESNTIAPTTRIACARTARIAGRSYPCSHPDLRRPLTPADALAYSCNTFFAATASRLPRRAFDAARASLGLPPQPARLEIAQAALGLDGVKATPRQMLEVLRRMAVGDSRLSIRAETRRTVLEGLRGAATFGTASAIGTRGIDALAKTGSMGGARPYGLVVAVTPSSRPSYGIVVLAAGAAGRDAAEIAAEELAAVPGLKIRSTSEGGAPLPATVRVGFARSSGGYDVRTLDLEDYVARVIAGEAAVRSPDAALDALAIAIRTFAAANPRRHGRDGFDLCDLTHCQVARPATDATRASARRTRGRVLRDGDGPAGVFYTASCGGRSELASAVWPGAADPPFLPSRADPNCADVAAWTADIRATDLLRALTAAGFKGDTLRDVRVISRTGSGRAATIQVRGLTPPTIAGQDLRMVTGRTLGWNLIKSTAFDVARTATGYRFTGRGSGHGVGLCVLGSVRMAANGASAESILDAYFPGLASGVSGSRPPTSPNVTVALSAGEEPLRAMIENLAQHLWTTVGGRIGEGTATAATLRFHPTVESYRRVTGQPWWVAATTSGSESQLLPAGVLRDRGILEQTIAHEIAHIVTAPALAGRPLWVKEGAAMYFAGEKYGARPSKPKCPTDAELTRAPSAGALREAYARAAACFANRVQAGEDWRSIK